MSHPDTIDWSLYRSFLAVLRHGSLSAAARQLGVAQPTVGRHIDALETALGVALFTRTQHGYQPTALAEALRSQAEALGHQVAALQRLARSRADDVAGVVRITASQTLGVAALPGILAQLTRDWPQLRFELDLDNALHDLLQRQSDLAVRLIPPVQAGLVARQVGQLALGFFAHRRYIEAHGVPADLAALSRHRLIGLRDMPDWLARLLAQGGLAAADVPAEMMFRTDSDLAQQALVAAGAGIGLCPVAVARRQADWVPILPERFAPSFPVWLAMHENLRQLPAHRTVFRALADGLAAWLG